MSETEVDYSVRAELEAAPRAAAAEVRSSFADDSSATSGAPEPAPGSLGYGDEFGPVDEDEADYFGEQQQPGPEDWTGPPPDEYAAVVNTLGAIVDYLNAGGQPHEAGYAPEDEQPYEPALGEFDPLADNAGEQLRGHIRAEINRELGGAVEEAAAAVVRQAAWDAHVAEQTAIGEQEAQEQAEYDAAAELKSEIFAEARKEVGDFNREWAEQWAKGLFPAYERIHGRGTPEAAEAALRHAARLARPSSTGEGLRKDTEYFKALNMIEERHRDRYADLGLVVEGAMAKQALLDGTAQDPRAIARAISRSFVASQRGGGR